MIPILIDHDYNAIIGFANVIDGKLHVKFKGTVRITKEGLQNIFGNIGFLEIQGKEEDGELFLSEIQIMEWSFCALAME